jgi:heme exporter protein C
MVRMKILIFLWIIIICYLSFLFSPPAAGFIGESSRIVFFHVPIAWLTVLSFLVAMIQAIRFLKTRDPIYDLMSAVACRQGFLFAILATVTGSVFARVMWQSFWNWDPRETSITILLFIYAAYLVLRASIEDPQRRAILSSVYATFSFIPALFLIFIVPRVYFSLHPDTLINVQGKIQMYGRILFTFVFSLGGFTALYFWMYNLECRIEKLLYRKEGYYD